MPSERCREAIDGAVGDAGEVPIVSLLVRCSAVCTAAEGQGTVSVVLADGRRMESGFGWSSAGPGPQGPMPAEDPPLPVVPLCRGVPVETCSDMARSAMFEVGDARGQVVAIVVTCTAPPCGPARGEGTTEVTFADGTGTSSQWLYESGG